MGWLGRRVVVVVRSEIVGICRRTRMLLPLGVRPPAISVRAVWRVPLTLPPPLAAKAIQSRGISRQVSTRRSMRWGQRLCLVVALRSSVIAGPLQLRVSSRVVYRGGESTGRWEWVIGRFLELLVLLPAWGRDSLQPPNFLEFSSLFLLQLGLFGVLEVPIGGGRTNVVTLQVGIYYLLLSSVRPRPF